MEKTLDREDAIYFTRPQKNSVEVERYAKESTINARKEIKSLEKGKPIRRKRRLSMRVRKFLIKHKFSKRLMEFGYHQRGVHWINQAIFHSETGCINCRNELDI